MSLCHGDRNGCEKYVSWSAGNDVSPLLIRLRDSGYKLYGLEVEEDAICFLVFSFFINFKVTISDF